MWIKKKKWNYKIIESRIALHILLRKYFLFYFFHFCYHWLRYLVFIIIIFNFIIIFCLLFGFII